MPVAPTSGFKLQALPEPYKVSPDIGTYNTAQTQQAFAGGLKNAQAALLAPQQTRTALKQLSYEAGKADQLSRLLDPEEKSLLASFNVQRAKAVRESNILQSTDQFYDPTNPNQNLAVLNKQGEVARARLAAGTGFGVYDAGNGMRTPFYTKEDGGVSPLMSPSVTAGLFRDAKSRLVTQQRVDVEQANFETPGGGRKDKLRVQDLNAYGQPVGAPRVIEVNAGEITPGIRAHPNPGVINDDNTYSPLNTMDAVGVPATGLGSFAGVPVTPPASAQPLRTAPLAQVAALPAIAGNTSQAAAPLAQPAAMPPADAPAVVTLAPAPVATPATPAPTASTPAPAAPAKSQQAEPVPSVIDNNVLLTDAKNPLYKFSKEILKAAPVNPGRADPEQQKQRDKMSEEATSMEATLKDQKTAADNFKMAFEQARSRGLGTGWQQAVVPKLMQQAFGFPEGQNLEAASLMLANSYSNTFSKFRAFGAATQLLLPAKPSERDDETTIINKLNYYDYLNQRAQTELKALIGATQYQIPASEIRNIFSRNFNAGNWLNYNDWVKENGLRTPQETEKIISQREAWLKDPKNTSDPTYKQKQQQFEQATGIRISVGS